MFNISLRQEKLFATMKTVCELSCSLLQTFTNPGETLNSLRSQARRAYLTERRMLANVANLGFRQSL